MDRLRRAEVISSPLARGPILTVGFATMRTRVPGDRGRIILAIKRIVSGCGYRSIHFTHMEEDSAHID